MRRVVRVYLPQNKNKVNTLLVKLDCCIFTFIITACIPDRPWYARHEKAEIKFWKDIRGFYQKLTPIVILIAQFDHGYKIVHSKILKVKGMRNCACLEPGNCLALLENATDAGKQ